MELTISRGSPVSPVKMGLPYGGPDIFFKSEDDMGYCEFLSLIEQRIKLMQALLEKKPCPTFYHNCDIYRDNKTLIDILTESKYIIKKEEPGLLKFTVADQITDGLNDDKQLLIELLKDAKEHAKIIRESKEANFYLK